MTRTKSLLASAAAAGLLVSNPALAASTRSSDALPGAASPVLSRASAPLTDANNQNPQRARLLALFAAIGAVGLVVAAAAGGGHDSPG